MRSTPFRQYNFVVTIVWILITSQGAASQTFGAFPPNLDWHQIDTDTCRIIFPSSLSSQAQRVANTIHYLRREENKDIGIQTHKIDIVLNNQSTLANGFVAIAPWNSQFITTPFHDNFELGSIPWLDLLAVHEYRHVVQLSTARTGLTKLLYYLFGQESWAGATNLALPDWFTEGDAVWAETILTKQGRGRIPNFLKGYKALASENGLYPYRKVRNGSIKDFVPNHYRLGYLMVKYGLEHYEQDLWKNVLREAAAYKGLFYPFSAALKRRTGMSTSDFYDVMIQEFQQNNQDSEIESGEAKILVASNTDTYTDFLHPQPTSRGDIIYYKRSFEKTGAFYRLNEQTETRLAARGRSIETYFSTRDNLIAWTELSSHPRWAEINYHDIILYDIAKKKRRKITSKGKYFSPDISLSKDKIVAVHFGESAESHLSIINIKSQQEEAIAVADDWVFTFPRWVNDDQEIVSAVRDHSGNMGLIMIDLTTLQIDTLLPFSNQLINHPYVEGGLVVFSAVHNLGEMIYSIDLESRETRSLTDRGIASYQPSLRQDSLFYVTYTANGHRINAKSMSPVNLSPARQKILPSIPFVQSPLENLKTKQYKSSKYRVLKHAFNLHTWGFDYDDPELIFRALSNNVLNNVELQAGIKYNYDNELFIPFASLTAGMLYPQFLIGISGLKRSAVIEEEIRTWRETNVFGEIFTDLDFSSGIYTRQLTPFAGLSHTTLAGDFELDFSSVVGGLSFVQQRIKARKNLFTKNGQFVEVAYRDAINDLMASQIQLRTALALPGLGINHSLILQADHKRDRDEADYEFSNGLSHRGFGIIPATRAWRLAADYHLPLAYPDWGFGGLVYLYRIRADIFFEYSNTRREGQNDHYYSTGIEFVFDVNLVNSVAATVGFRISRRLNKELAGTDYELTIPVYRF
ncbi:MAG: hypothetical protein OEQ53_12855 [Saprospiraceae bacterium]|nr:hypothetical protein [Saprospiraceae bacterium]